MNILFVNEYAQPNIVSGAEHSMHALAEALTRSPKAKIHILSPQLSRGKTSLGLKFPFPKKIKPGKTLTPLWFNNPLFWLYAAFFIIKAIKDYDIKLIHVHGKYILPAAIIAGKLTKTPVVITVRDFKFLCPLALCFTHQKDHCHLSHYLFKEIPEYLKRYTRRSSAQPLIILRLILAKPWQYWLKWFLSQADQVIAVSPQLQKLYQRAGIKKAAFIYNLPPATIQASTKEIEKIREKYKLEDKKIIVSIGKLSYGKGTDALLRAMSLLVKKLPQVVLILAGSKNISLKTSFPSNTIYIGQVPHHQVMALYCLADVFVILSRWPEPLSRSALEALTAGLPIVASNRGGNQEIVKDNGFLVSPDDSQAVTDKLARILYHHQLKKQMSQASLKLIKTRFNRRQIIAKHLNLYRQLCCNT